MTLLAGSVSINGAGAASGTGLSKAIYDALVSGFGVSPGAVPHNVPGAQQQVAELANALGQVVIAYFLANAVITVPAGIAVTTSGSATTQTGATTAPATAVLT
jgi:hypothetical protein